VSGVEGVRELRDVRDHDLDRDGGNARREQEGVTAEAVKRLKDSLSKFK